MKKTFLNKIFCLFGLCLMSLVLLSSCSKKRQEEKFEIMQNFPTQVVVGYKPIISPLLVTSLNKTKNDFSFKFSMDRCTKNLKKYLNVIGDDLVLDSGLQPGVGYYSLKLDFYKKQKLINSTISNLREIDIYGEKQQIPDFNLSINDIATVQVNLNDGYDLTQFNLSYIFPWSTDTYWMQFSYWLESNDCGGLIDINQENSKSATLNILPGLIPNGGTADNGHYYFWLCVSIEESETWYPKLKEFYVNIVII